MKEQQTVKLYLQSLLSGDRRHASEICQVHLEANNSVKGLYEHIMKPALYEVGKLWEENKISVATEHLATAISEGVLNEIYAKMSWLSTENRKAVLACVNKEEHQVGIKMVADVFEMNGWESHFLGTGIPNDELLRYIADVKPAIIGVSLSIFFNYNNLLSLLKDLSNTFPDLPVIVGGQAFQHFNDFHFDQTNNVTYVKNLYELDSHIKKLSSLKS